MSHCSGVYVSVWARVRVEEVARRARRLILWSFNIVQCWFGRSFDWLFDWLVGLFVELE